MCVALNGDSGLSSAPHVHHLPQHRSTTHINQAKWTGLCRIQLLVELLLGSRKLMTKNWRAFETRTMCKLCLTAARPELPDCTPVRRLGRASSGTSICLFGCFPNGENDRDILDLLRPRRCRHDKRSKLGSVGMVSSTIPPRLPVPNPLPSIHLCDSMMFRLSSAPLAGLLPSWAAVWLHPLLSTPPLAA